MLDIDGTLAPISATPDTAFVPLETLHLLTGLAGLPAVHVALVSGRSVADAMRLLTVEGAWFIGNHGLEIRTPEGDLTALPEARAFEVAIAGAAVALEELAREAPGVLVENKRWTLSLHYRLAGDGYRAPLVADAREIAQRHGLDVTEGRMVVELRPPGNINKGFAAVALARRLGALEKGSIFYAGDDQTDEDAFRELRKSRSDAVTVKVLGENAATPTAAEFTLATTDELRRLLEWVASHRTVQPETP